MTRDEWLQSEDRKTLDEIDDAGVTAAEAIGLLEDATYPPALLPLLVAVALAAREHDARCGAGHESTTSAAKLREVLVALTRWEDA